MDNEIAKALIALLFTGIVGGTIKVYLDYKARLIEKIWEKRLEAYMAFVTRTSLLPKYEPKEVTWQDVIKLSSGFSDWYFEGHGLVLSSKIRDEYFILQEYLKDTTKDKRNSEQKLNDTEYNDLRERCSKVRTSMAQDLESRESPIWHHFKKGTKA